MKRLKVAATKATSRAAAAKTRVREAKAALKQARKLFKIEKRAAKEARRKVDAAVVSVRKPPAPKPVRAQKPGPPKMEPKSAAKKSKPRKPRKPRRASKPRAPKDLKTMRSAAEVAKSVIERLHAPPPILPPTPNIPDESPAAGESIADEPTKV